MNPREKADIVSRLRKSIETGDVPFYRDEAGQMVWHTDTMEEAATEIASLRRELEEARTALNLFFFSDPDMEQILWGHLPDEKTMTFQISLGAYRRAAAIRNLAGEKADG